MNTAKNKDGQIIHIESVESGKQIDLFCECCNAVVVAKKGAINIHHFAHLQGTECEYSRLGGEGILHMTAKRLIKERGAIWLPITSLEYSDALFLDELLSIPNNVSVKWKLFEIDNVVLESRENGYIPDLLCTVNGRPLAIEICVTNAVSYKKKELIARDGVNCIEIKLRKNIEVSDLERYLMDEYAFLSYNWIVGDGFLLPKEEIDLFRKDIRIWNNRIQLLKEFNKVYRFWQHAYDCLNNRGTILLEKHFMTVIKDAKTVSKELIQKCKIDSEWKLYKFDKIILEVINDSFDSYSVLLGVVIGRKSFILDFYTHEVGDLYGATGSDLRNSPCLAICLGSVWTTDNKYLYFDKHNIDNVFLEGLFYTCMYKAYKYKWLNNETYTNLVSQTKKENDRWTTYWKWFYSYKETNVGNYLLEYIDVSESEGCFNIYYNNKEITNVCIIYDGYYSVEKKEFVCELIKSLIVKFAQLKLHTNSGAILLRKIIILNSKAYSCYFDIFGYQSELPKEDNNRAFEGMCELYESYFHLSYYYNNPFGVATTTDATQHNQ